mmetsp:Transcript_1865/g.4161  ORF Transcript_1865/g.4161 Transcript_1865/m.4161 type:complete len:235 (+) Transcript_1865:242-946(+)
MRLVRCRPASEVLHGLFDVLHPLLAAPGLEQVVLPGFLFLRLFLANRHQLLPHLVHLTSVQLSLAGVLPLPYALGCHNLLVQITLQSRCHLSLAIGMLQRLGQRHEVIHARRDQVLIALAPSVALLPLDLLAQELLVLLVHAPALPHVLSLLLQASVHMLFPFFVITNRFLGAGLDFAQVPLHGLVVRHFLAGDRPSLGSGGQSSHSRLTATQRAGCRRALGARPRAAPPPCSS